MMRKIIGILLILGGVALGLYLGVWVFLVGGIVDIVQGARTTPINGLRIVWGLVEVCVLASLVGGLAFRILALPGLGLIIGGTLESWRKIRLNRSK